MKKKKIWMMKLLVVALSFGVLTGCQKKETIENEGSFDSAVVEDEKATEANADKQKDVEVEGKGEEENKADAETEAETEAEAEGKLLAKEDKEDGLGAADEDISMEQESLEPTEEKTEASNVFVCYGDEVDTAEIVFEEYNMEVSEWKTKVYFAASGVAKDFTLYKLSYEDVTEDGQPVFQEEVLYQNGDLEEGKGLMASIVFYGDMPEYGYSYVDEKGKLQKFYLVISGEDGSLQTSYYGGETR